MEMEMKIFGKSGQRVTRVGLGGEGILRTTGKTDEAREVILSALTEGITYYDCARVYSDSELYYGSIWREQPDQRERVFQASKSASRSRKVALRDLDETLFRLKTDYLDLWQIHDVRTLDDLEQIAGPDGALEAFIEAKEDGKVRFIGVTGHHDSDILTRAVSDWPVDSVMLPVNPVEGIIGGFLTRTLPAAKAKGIAVIGMKILGGGYFLSPQLGVTPDVLIRYALGWGITVAIVGCSTPFEVVALAEMGRSEKVLTKAEKTNLLDKFRPNVRKLAFYRGAT